MEQIREYLVSILCASMICGIALALVGKKETLGKLMKILTGLILTVVVLSPWVSIRLDDITFYLEDLQFEAEDAVASGSAYAASSMEEIIIENVQAYILDKAASQGVEVTVEVRLSKEYPQVPTGVTISGSVSPYAKRILSQDISQNLGIPVEDQLWN